MIGMVVGQHQSLEVGRPQANGLQPLEERPTGFGDIDSSVYQHRPSRSPWSWQQKVGIDIPHGVWNGHRNLHYAGSHLTHRGKNGHTPNYTPRDYTGGMQPIPRLIWRNTVLLAITQAVVGTGIQLIPALGAVSMLQLLGNNTWSGLATALAGLARMLVAFPVGRITDTLGRKAGVYLGLGMAGVGAIVTGIGFLSQSLWGFGLGILVFAGGVGATAQLRVAAADMYPPERRSEGISLVLSGSLVGALLSPGVVALAQWLGPQVGASPLGLVWFLIPLLVIPALLLVRFIRPDPREIGRDLARYFPHTNRRPSAPAEHRENPGARSAATWVGIAAQGQMTMLMAMTSLALYQQGCSFELISVSVAVHVMGMFALSWPVGILADRWGRKPMMVLGLALSGLGAILVVSSPLYSVITLGTFLVGLGWCGAFNGATTVITDVTSPSYRGRAVGLLDQWSNLAGTFLPILAGFMVQGWGLWTVGVAGVAILLPPLWLALRLDENQPGQYAAAG
jgi:MFS family permease